MDKEINNIELNAILYYADFLSLLNLSIPVTDNCKYFYIHNTPINSCYILGLTPIYDEQNQYFQLALNEYVVLRNKFGEEGVISFIENLANLSACGAVTAEQMLKRIHYYSNKRDKKHALDTYHRWKKNKKYIHTTINEDGKEEEHECSMYAYHVERMLRERRMEESTCPNPKRHEIPTIESLL